MFCNECVKMALKLVKDKGIPDMIVVSKRDWMEKDVMKGLNPTRVSNIE